MADGYPIWLAFAGIFAAAGIMYIDGTVGKLIARMRGSYDRLVKEEKKNMALTEFQRQKSISEKVDYYEGRKGSFVDRKDSETRAILRETGRTGEYVGTVITCLVLGAAGTVGGTLLLKNAVAGICVGTGLALAPTWRLKAYRNRYRKFVSAQLESATSMITSSYIRSSDFIGAVKENLDRLSPIIRKPFSRFVTEAGVDPGLRNCVRDLRDSISDNIFREWCETVIRTLDNSEMKEALLPVCQKYSSVRIVQDEIDAEVASETVSYFVMLAMVPGAYALVWLMNRDWFAYFTTTLAGKGCVALSFAVILFSVIKLIAVMQPVEFRR